MTPEDAFFTLHSGLDREGPGTRESLDWAMAAAEVARDARVLDAGCGPGADIEGLLEAVPEGQVVAMDLHQPYIDRLASRHAVDARVLAIPGDMADPEGVFDLIWSAGSLYFLGVTEGLQAWRPHLKEGGRVAFSQLAWAVDNPSPEARTFWQSYPAMTDRDGVLQQVAAAGFRVTASRWLPEAGWDAYLQPLAARIEALRSEAEPALQLALDEEEKEVLLRRAHGGDYGYLQVVCEPL